MNMNPTFLDLYRGLIPETILTIFLIILSIMACSSSLGTNKNIANVSLIGISLAMLSAVCLLFSEPHALFMNSFISDTFSLLFRIIILITSGLAIIMSINYVNKFGDNVAEYYLLLISATLGGMVMVAANELILLFVALETLGISSYLLAGYTRSDRRSNEASVKYLLVGATASAFILYAMSLVYGFTGETTITQIAGIFSTKQVTLLTYAMILFLMGGITFKISAVPFHIWTPDVYEGAPTPVSAFLSVGSKVAGLAVIIKFVYILFNDYFAISSLMLTIVAILTMTVGNVIALTQRNMKRMLAYSSIAQAGYMLIGSVYFDPIGVSSIIYYIITYLFMNLGAWMGAILFTNQTGSDKINDYSGLFFKSPVIALSITICLLSLAGIPITAGFFSKFYLFQSAIAFDTSLTWLIIVALINSVISVYYYLNVVRVMFVKDQSDLVKTFNDDSKSVIPACKSLKTALIFSVICVLLLGIFASPIIKTSNRASYSLFMIYGKLTTEEVAFTNHLPQLSQMKIK